MILQYLLPQLNLKIGNYIYYSELLDEVFVLSKNYGKKIKLKMTKKSKIELDLGEAYFIGKLREEL